MAFNKDIEIKKTFVAKVKQALFTYHMLVENETMIVGVSGGADSVSLLYALNSIAEELSFNIVVCHLDHCMRSDSADDAGFVEVLAKRLGLPFVLGTSDVPDILNKQGGSPEDVARNCRLKFFEKTAEKFSAVKVAVAHNSDDQAETVLMRFFRGAGVNGLSGMSPVKEFEAYKFTCIRPLLFISREEIERYLQAIGADYRRDFTNLDTKYTRNKIRHEILPMLEQSFNPNLKSVLSSMSEIVRTDYEFLESTAEETLSRICSRADKDAIEVDALKLMQLPEGLQNNIIRVVYKKLKSDLSRFASYHIQEIKSLMSERPDKAVVDLPSGISVAKENNQLIFYRKK